MIGKRWGSGNQMRELNLERMRSIMSLKNWRNKLVSDCLSGVSYAGDELEGLQWSIEFKVSQSVQGFFKHNFCVKPYVLREPRRDPTQVTVGSMNMGYIYPTLSGIELTTYLIRHKREPIPVGQSDGLENDSVKSSL